MGSPNLVSFLTALPPPPTSVPPIQVCENQRWFPKEGFVTMTDVESIKRKVTEGSNSIAATRVSEGCVGTLHWTWLWSVVTDTGGESLTDESGWEYAADEWCFDQPSRKRAWVPSPPPSTAEWSPAPCSLCRQRVIVGEAVRVGLPNACSLESSVGDGKAEHQTEAVDTHSDATARSALLSKVLLITDLLLSQLEQEVMMIWQWQGHRGMDTIEVYLRTYIAGVVLEIMPFVSDKSLLSLFPQDALRLMDSAHRCDQTVATLRKKVQKAGFRLSASMSTFSAIVDVDNLLRLYR